MQMRFKFKMLGRKFSTDDPLHGHRFYTNWTEGEREEEGEEKEEEERERERYTAT